ncbi:MAG TPA: hypothetical protein VMW27_02935 [Thermoanaerobaculia bacterium]|nr:hypothetical protein [Thermoanaerobaculia bacterium]
MTEPDFSGSWTIRSSTSRFFPTHSSLEIKRKRPRAADFALAVTWENGTTLKVIEKGFSLENGALKGSFCHPKNKPKKDQEKFQLVVTWCPATFADGKQRLFGLLLPAVGSFADEGTGVWVAEAIPREQTT